MKYNRIRFSQEASKKLSHLKGRTGLTPNILSRIGFMMSITDPTIPNPDDYPSDSEREIDRHVLTGQWDPLFVALVKERCKQDGLIDVNEDDQLFAYFRAHMNRGVLLLQKRVRNLTDLIYLMPREILDEVQN